MTLYLLERSSGTSWTQEDRLQADKHEESGAETGRSMLFNYIVRS